MMPGKVKKPSAGKRTREKSSSAGEDPQNFISMATIDVGAHSARLLVAQVHKKSRQFTVLEELEHPVPLGADVFREGSIRDESIHLLCSILLNFREKMDEYSVVHYKAIATSAVREARNGDIFLERIRHVTGIGIELFSGTDEARLDYKAVADGITERSGFSGTRALIADIGTGACQVSAFDHGKLCFTETLKVGTLRALEQIHGTYNAGTLNYYTALSIDRIFGELQVLAENLKSTLIIAMGSSSRVLLRLFPGKQTGANGPVCITREEFFLLRSGLSDMSYEQICEKYQLIPDLAEMVQVCCMILDNLLHLTEAHQILIPMVSTKTLLLMDFIERTFALPDHFEEQMENLIIRTAARYHCDDDYGKRTAAFAGALFEKLAFLHGLGHREELLLRISARLHKCGLFINNQAYHKHSAYIIANTEIPGISVRERSIASLVVRYHRKGPPKNLHQEYITLPVQDREVVHKLSALLRIACALAHLAPCPESLAVKTGEDGSVILVLGDNVSYFPESVTEVDRSYFRNVFACRILFA